MGQGISLTILWHAGSSPVGGTFLFLQVFVLPSVNELWRYVAFRVSEHVLFAGLPGEEQTGALLPFAPTLSSLNLWIQAPQSDALIHG